MYQFCGFHGSLAACLHLSGEDALSFLRSQMTVAVPDPSEQRSVYGLWLNENGRILADSHGVALAEDSCLLWSFGCPASQLTQCVQKNIVADDVEVADLTDDYEVTLVDGTVASGDTMKAMFQEGGLSWPMQTGLAEAHDFIAVRGNPLDSAGLTLVGAPSFHAALKQRLASQIPSVEIASIDSEAFTLARISNQVPLIPRDLNHRNLPQEGTFPSAVVDYAKGCFPGQEIMASFRKTGKVHKRLRAFEVVGTGTLQMDLPVEIYAGVSVVGSLTSLASGEGAALGMGMLRERARERTLSIRDREGEVYSLRILPA